MNVQVRAGAVNIASAVAGATAAVGFMSTHTVDLYAVWNQLNVVFADLTKLVMMVTPLATAAYAVYSTTMKNRIADLAKEPDIKGIVTTPTLANATPVLAASDKVVATSSELPPAAKV